MDPTLLVSLTGAACLGVALLLATGAFFLRRVARKRAIVAANDKLIAAIGAQATSRAMEEHGPGIWEGNFRGRRLRWNLREVEYDAGPRQQLALGTPVPTGRLGVTHRTLIYGVQPPQHEFSLVRVGDASFDARFYVHADLEHLSLLQSNVREALRFAADEAQLRIRNGWLWIDLLATPSLIDTLSRRLDDLYAAAASLDAVSGEVELRVQKMSGDPVARVRCAVLDLLIERGASDFTTWIARPLMTDIEPQVVCRAAEILSDTERLLAITCDRAMQAELRIRAATVLARIGGPAERLAAANALCQEEGPLASQALELCTGLADDAENVLIELVHRQSGSLARSAVALLGIVGSARSLVVLQSLCDAQDTDNVLRADARAVLAVIRSKSGVKRRSSPNSLAPASTPPKQRRGAPEER